MPPPPHGALLRKVRPESNQTSAANFSYWKPRAEDGRASYTTTQEANLECGTSQRTIDLVSALRSTNKDEEVMDCSKLSNLRN